MKIYISGKISHLPEKEVKDKFEKAFQKLKAHRAEVINPCNLPHEHDHTWESYMKEGLKSMLDCDIVYMLSDWKQSRGAITEYELAKLLKIKVLYEEN